MMAHQAEAGKVPDLFPLVAELADYVHSAAARDDNIVGFLNWLGIRFSSLLGRCLVGTWLITGGATRVPDHPTN